ncbi:MAG: substrate-binding domain-containing protein, partial [bacterium]
VCSIYLDAKKLGHELTKRYLDCGKDDIVFVQPKANLIDLGQYIEGIKEAYQEAGKAFSEEQIIPTSTHYEKNLPQFTEYFKTHRHEVVLTGYDKTAVAVVNAALDNGIRVPEDMEIIGLMDTSYAIMSRPALTSVHVPVYEMGAMAVRLLTKILNDEEITDPAVSVIYRLIERQTTK